MCFIKHTFILIFLFTLGRLVTFAQDCPGQYISKRYNIFFEINHSDIDSTFKDNGKTLRQMRADISATLNVAGAVPDSLLILSTASPDGRWIYNKQLARHRAQKTSRLLLDMFPEFRESHIQVQYLEEDWSGLRQIIKANPDFPQGDQMLQIIDSQISVDSKEAELRKCAEGWMRLTDEYMYVLRSSSVTLTVIGKADEYAVSEPLSIPTPPAYIPIFEHPSAGDIITRPRDPVKFKKTILAARTNLLLPGMSVGIEIPIQEHWSVGFDYYYPWFVSSGNKWCVEMLGWFVDAKYWFTNDKTRWTPDSKLKGHGVGVYAGTGYYDFQNKTEGAQGEYINFGVDYTYALPVANDKLRLEFNIGLGFLKTWYRPYTPSSDYSDLIKEPGVKYRTTNFLAPTMAGVKLVWPITVTIKKNPYINMAKREQRSAERKANRAGGVK